MTLAPWRPALGRALHRNRSRPDSRYPQLATVSPDGRPANRTVVFRGFLPEGDRLTIVTDLRSHKIQHLSHTPAAELCWYFSQTREQFRLGGEVQIIGPTATEAGACKIRLQAWEALSDQARQQFAWPHPGAPREAEGFEILPLDPKHPLDTFAVLVLEPDRVDHLELRGNPQNRWRYWRQGDGAWHGEAVNP